MDNTQDIVEDLDLFYFRQLAVSLKDFELQKKIDVEIKMREGTKKLLAACNREQQMLQGSKSLLVSDTRVLAYMSELQKRKTAEYVGKQASPKSGASSSETGSGMVPCKGKLAVSGKVSFGKCSYFTHENPLLHPCSMVTLVPQSATSPIPSRLAMGTWVSSARTADTGTTDCHKVPYHLG